MNIILIQWETRQSLINPILWENREDSLTYFAVPYRTEMQTPRLVQFTLERQTTRKNCQNREMDSLDSKYLERKALGEPSQDRHDDMRSGKCDYGDRL